MYKKVISLAAMLIVAIMLGVSAGSVLADSISPNRGVAEESSSNAPLRPVAGSHAIGSRAADSADQEDWAVRTYRGATGLNCYEVGQIRDGVFGRRGADGFRAQGRSQPSGMCTNLGDAPDGVAITIHTRGTGGPVPNRSVLYGLAQPTVESITVRGTEGTSELVPGKDGTFLRVYDGAVDFSDLEVTFHYVDGETKVLGPDE